MPKQQTMRWVDLRVGLLVVAAIVALIILILAVSGDISFFKKRMLLYTDLPGAEGLKVGDEVRLAGVRVGTVKSVSFSSEIPKDMGATSAVRVEMQIEGDDAQKRIRGDSRAILRQLGLLGGEYVNISPGTLAADPVKNGDVIPGLQETTIGQVVESSDDLLNGFKQLSAKLNQITQTITDGKGTIGRFVNDETFYLNLNKTTLEAQELLKRVREGDGTMGKLINDPKLYNDLQASVNSLQEVTDKISAGKGTIGKLVNEQEVYDKVNDAAARLDSASQRIDEITAQVRSGKGAIGGLIYDEKLHDDATAAIASLKAITDRIDRGEGTLGKLSRDEALYNNLNQLSAESVKLLYDFRQNPKKYLRVKLAVF
ncbi:MAG TPA: MlaD family protein [Blastocatellia bacterium]|nr:MlaD family protein [Blastocatellia bacterium]